MKAIETWLKDFLRYRREIVYSEVPDLEPAVPFVLSAQRVFGIGSTVDRNITLRYYRSEEETDSIDVREAFLTPSADDMFAKTFALPPRSQLAQEVRRYSADMRWFYDQWSHPYLAAAKELRQQVEYYNRTRPEPFEDATYLTDVKLRHWTISYIQAMKQLSNRFPQVAGHFTEYQRGVTVVHLHNLDEPKIDWVRDGLIRSFYFRSDEDRVEVVRLGDKTELRNQDGILKPKFGFESKDAFLASTSSIVYYLRDKLGLD